MARPARRILILLVPALASFSAPVLAAPTLPDPRFCIVEERLVGCPSGDAQPGCPAKPLATPGFSVRLRDVDHVPLANRTVVLRFTDPAIRLFEDLRPGTTLDCANRAYLRVTDSEGWVTFAPRIGGTSLAEAAAEISSSTIVLGAVSVTTTDLDGDGLTGLPDLALVAANFLGQSPDRRTDFDGCVDPLGGATTLSDLGLFALQFGRPAPDGDCN